jgi:hypothetical protein
VGMEVNFKNYLINFQYVSAALDQTTAVIIKIKIMMTIKI